MEPRRSVRAEAKATELAANPIAVEVEAAPKVRHCTENPLLVNGVSPPE